MKLCEQNRVVPIYGSNRNPPKNAQSIPDPNVQCNLASPGCQSTHKMAAQFAVARTRGWHGTAVLRSARGLVCNHVCYIWRMSRRTRALTRWWPQEKGGRADSLHICIQGYIEHQKQIWPWLLTIQESASISFWISTK